MSSYDGGKAGSGVFQHLINLMPRHDMYIEPFLGAGAVMKRKAPAASSIGIERDASVYGRWTGDEVPGLTVMQYDGIRWLRDFLTQKRRDAERAAGSKISGNGDGRRQASPEAAMSPGRDANREIGAPRVLIYCDPPYVMSTRSWKGRLYQHDLSDKDHRRLLAVLLGLTAADPNVMIMISGYRSKLYCDALAEWRTSSYMTTNRRGKHVEEWVWMNFPAPAELHDYRYLGADFRERERIRRRQRRWKLKLAAMEPIERLALMAALREIGD